MKSPAFALFFPLLAAACLNTVYAADAAAGNTPQPAGDLARFVNGDSLRGSVAGFDREGLHWRSAYSRFPIVFKPASLLDVQFRPRKMPANAAQSFQDILLANGDLLPGVIVSLNDKSLLLETWYAGRLAIPRAMIKSISASGILYQGPAGMAGWVIGPAAGNDTTWSYKDGVLTNANYATLGRDLKLPSLARIEFDLATVGNFQIFVCSNQPGAPGISYLFQINAATRVVDVARYSPVSANARIGQPVTLADASPAPLVLELPQPHAPPVPVGPNGVLQLNAMGMGTGDLPTVKYHFDIRINRETETMWLYVNGRMAEQYSHLDDLPKMGGSFIFCPGSTMEISKVKVSRWNGGLDESHSDAGAGANEEGLKAENRDVIHGKLKAISGGKAFFATSRGDMGIPLAQVEWIRTASGDTGQAKAGANDVRALFLVSGHATMEIESWDAKGVTATSPDFGRAVFSPDAFRRLEFNPGAHLSAGKETADDAGGDDDGP